MGHLRSSDNWNIFIWRIRNLCVVCYFKCLDLLSVEILFIGSFWKILWCRRGLKWKDTFFFIKIVGWFLIFIICFNQKVMEIFFSTNWTKKNYLENRRQENVFDSMCIITCHTGKKTVQVKLCVYVFFCFILTMVIYENVCPSTSHLCLYVYACIRDDHFYGFFSPENKMTSSSNKTDSKLLTKTYIPTKHTHAKFKQN